MDRFEVAENLKFTRKFDIFSTLERLHSCEDSKSLSLIETCIQRHPNLLRSTATATVLLVHIHSPPNYTNFAILKLPNSPETYILHKLLTGENSTNPIGKIWTYSADQHQSHCTPIYPQGNPQNNISPISKLKDVLFFEKLSAQFYM